MKTAHRAHYYTKTFHLSEEAPPAPGSSCDQLTSENWFCPTSARFPVGMLGVSRPSQQAHHGHFLLRARRNKKAEEYEILMLI